MKEIMKRAWEMKKQNEKSLVSECLREAWKEHEHEEEENKNVIKKVIKNSYLYNLEFLKDIVKYYMIGKITYNDYVSMLAKDNIKANKSNVNYIYDTLTKEISLRYLYKNYK